MGVTLIIDNYDSFTWNVYADISVLNGNPLVKRNDEVTLEEIDAMYESGELERIVISPGPGHPRTDSGISRQVIMWGTGKVPILGVCMGLECIVDVLGGDIGYAGEIKHGKTSLVKHDAMGIFHNLPPLLSSTRYHSLSANLLTLPKELQVSATTSESGVIMAVRHRTATVEAVQYHPESVMSEGGRGLMANFLKIKGGKWGEDNAWCGVPAEGETEQGERSLPTLSDRPPVPKPDTIVDSLPVSTASVAPAPSLPTILNQIHTQRLQDVAEASAAPWTTPAILSRSLALDTAPPLIPFLPRLLSAAPHPAIMAEIKRASPSKGDIAIHASAPEQALKYALAGASVISVLTEPKWFKGNLSDLAAVRAAVDSLPNRPALLRKDFILAPYQIDEARLHGADTVLLIVAMLETDMLRDLYNHSVNLGMEPLVEVNNAEELETALQVGAKVIGVNNRNLHDFKVDMSTTSRVNDVLRKYGRDDVVICALSGISTPEDVQRYVKEGVQAVLVGESLMRAQDTKSFLRALIGLPPVVPTPVAKPLVKICGLRSVVDAKAAIDAGADLLGIICVTKAKRYVPRDVAREIAAHARAVRYSRPPPSTTTVDARSPPLPWFASHARRLQSGRGRLPLVVGVFQNQTLEEILDVVEDVGLDIVQLHGDEPQGWAKLIPVPVTKVFRVTSEGTVLGGQVSRPGLNRFVLLDAAPASGSSSEGGGGEGRSFPWSHALNLVNKGENGTAEGEFPLPIMLAGGLNPGNVAQAITQLNGQVMAVDVSSGVDNTEGTGKDADKIKAFVKAVKG